MIKKIWIINGVLVLLTAMVSLSIFDVWSGRDNGIDGRAALPKPNLPDMQTFNPAPLKPENAYQAVVYNNLFSPDRREAKIAPPAPKPIETEPKPEESIQTLEKVEGKKILLYGVILLPNYRAAIITDPDAKDNQREQRKVIIGEKIGDYKIVDIQKERVILEKKKEMFELAIFDINNPKDRKAAVKQSSVKKEAVPKIITTQVVSDKAKAPEKDSKKLEDDQWEIVDTPFGKMKRPKK